MKKLALLYSTYTPTIDSIIAHLKDFDVTCLTAPDNLDTYNLVANINYKSEVEQNHVAVHHSLLPAFESKEPVKDAILAGVKVTGITFYYTNPKKIITQYPIFISNASHYDDVANELEYLEQTIYPLILERLLENKPFEIRNLLSKGCSGNCGGCNSCKH